ncbi:MAG: ATP-binding protein [bacterium]|nr:ATP-binding protein [bacterium]
MYLNSNDERRAYLNNEQLQQEYEELFDDLFDYVLNEEFGIHDFDITAEVVPDPSLEEAHRHLAAIMDWIDAREEASSDEISILRMVRKMKLSRQEKLFFWLLLTPQLSVSCYSGYQKYLQLRGESKTSCAFFLDLMRYAIAINSSEFLKFFTEEGNLGKYCLVKTKGNVFFGSEIGLREAIIRRSRNLSVDTGIYRRYYEYYENHHTLYGIDGYYEKLLSLFQKEEQEAESPDVSPCLVQLMGGAYSGKKSLLHEVAKKLDKRLLVIRLDELKTAGAELFDVVISELQTECYLERPIVYVEDDLEAGKIADARTHARIQELFGMLLQENRIVFCSLLEQDARNMAIPFAKIAVGDDISVKQAVWQGVFHEYPHARLDKADHLASKYSLNAGMIRRVMEQAELYRQMEGCKYIEKGHLEQAVFSSGSINFEGLASRVPTVFGWEDIELKDSVRRILQLVMKRVNLKYQVGERCGLNKKLAYGKGVTVLFYGKPGTGKTMCAQVLAKELGMELYRVDISQLVSKYIGETEKNLAKVFDEAKKGNIILFFDEADAIFSQRTEISGTNDKHANAEVSFLLQKMEEYPGVAILATNLVKNFDPAVMRRLTYSINFELPDKETILKLWQTILPGHVKLDPSIDLEFFASNFELSGSNIKSILYNAAYMAASEDADEILITPAELIPAIQMEYEKIGEFLNRSSLGQYMVYAKV